MSGVGYVCSFNTHLSHSRQWFNIHLFLDVLCPVNSDHDLDVACYTEPNLNFQWMSVYKQETRMLSQALKRAMTHSRNQLEEVNNRKPWS